MKRKLILFCLVFSVIVCTQLKAQYVFVPDQNGRTLTDARYENLTGSPFFIDKWVSGEVKLSNGEIIKPAALKLDMVTDKLLFQTDGKTYEFFPRATAFNLHTPNGVKTFLWKEGNAKSSGYYEVLYDGKIKMLKKNKKSVLEVKGYNSANIQKTVDESKKYFVIDNGVEKEVKMTKKSFAEALPQFKSKILSFEPENNKNIEKNYIDLISTLATN